jgi:serine protease Do
MNHLRTLCACALASWWLMLPAAEQAWSQEAADAVSRGDRLAPRAFRSAAAAITPCVVTIDTFGGLSTGVGNDSPRPAAAQTTGVVIGADGWIVTSTFNFLDRPPVITVRLPNGERKVATLAGRDETRKLCLLKIEGVAGLSTPTLADPATLRVGQWVVALGTGYGEQVPSLSAGIVSALNRVSGKAVQTDANLGPANYGGPLVDLEGRLVGICVPLNPGSTETAAGAEWYDSGIGFAVPLHGLDPLLERLKAGGTLRRGYLAVAATPYGEPPQGVEIQAVVPKFAADQAGLRKGDKLLTLGGVAPLDPAHLNVLVGQYYVGDTVAVEILRGMERMELKITLGQRPPAESNNKRPEPTKKGPPAPTPPVPPPAK